MGTLAQDLRFALRSFGRRPGLFMTSVLILAVGIGATTTIFSVVDGVLLRPLPYPDADQLTYFDEGSHSAWDFDDWREHAGSFAALVASWDESVDLTGEGAPERLTVARVTDGFLGVFGASPLIGRTLAGDDFRQDASVAVLDHGLWLRRWGGDPSLVGRTVQIDGRGVVVVGVLTPGFRPPELMVGRRVDAWLPLDLMRDDLQDRSMHVLSVVGKRRPDVSLEAAQAEIDALRMAAAADQPRRYLREDGSLRPVPLLDLQEATVRGIGSTLLLLLGAVGLMLLIACSNVANLLLARGIARGRELSLRAALGAGRGRIAAQLLTESVALALAGGLLGIGLAFAGVEAFTRMEASAVPRLVEVSVDLRVLAFTVGVSLVTGLLFGVLPALQAVRTEVSETLKEGQTSMSESRRGRRIRGGLVIVELGLALVLLAGAGVLFRSFVGILAVDPGFDTEGLLTVPILLGSTYEEEERVQFVTALEERLRSHPEVEGVAVGWTLPFVSTGRSRCCWRSSVWADDAPEDAEALGPIITPVTEGYFDVLRAPVVRGRSFTAADGSANETVAIINRRMAIQLFGTDDVVGRKLRLVRGQLWTIVGVSEGVHHWGLDQELEAEVYVPYGRTGGGLPFAHVAVRARGETSSLVPAIRDVVWSLDPDLPLPDFVSMEERVSASVATPRFLLILLGTFAVVAGLLSSAGIYSSVLYTVGQRKREMGIRLALGAEGSDVRGLVLRHGLRLVAGGLALGIAGALAASRLLESFVWGIEPTDAPTFAAVAVLLASVAVAASWVPAWKASRTDPLETLRGD